MLFPTAPLAREVVQCPTVPLAGAPFGVLLRFLRGDWGCQSSPPCVRPRLLGVMECGTCFILPRVSCVPVCDSLRSLRTCGHGGRMLCGGLHWPCHAPSRPWPVALAVLLVGVFFPRLCDPCGVWLQGRDVGGAVGGARPRCVALSCCCGVSCCVGHSCCCGASCCVGLLCWTLVLLW